MNSPTDAELYEIEYRNLGIGNAGRHEARRAIYDAGFAHGIAVAERIERLRRQERRESDIGPVNK